MDTLTAGWLLDCHPSTDTFTDDVLRGMQQRPRALPSKYFYDERGSQLFDEICDLDEYYVTRTELAITRRHAHEMARCIGPQAMLIELGSGSSVKTRLLLNHLRQPAAYVPVDISREHLCRCAARLASNYPHTKVLPVCADFTEDFTIPDSRVGQQRRVVYFPGSTIGNFEQDAAHEILARMAQLVGDEGGLLIGIDLVKDIGVLEAAYDDPRGVTAEFNRNLLRRINRELQANFDVEAFRHHAWFNRRASRIEMHLVSERPQTVVIAEQAFELAAGEAIVTEYSHKYTIEGFAELAGAAGWTLREIWTDPRHYFAVLYLSTDPHISFSRRPR